MALRAYRGGKEEGGVTEDGRISQGSPCLKKGGDEYYNLDGIVRIGRNKDGGRQSGIL